MNINSVIPNTYSPYQGDNGVGASASPIQPNLSDDPSRSNIQEQEAGNITTDPPHKSGQTNSKTRPSKANQSDIEKAQLSNEEFRLVEQLKQTDSEVRSHEMAHIAAGGAYITSGASFTYQQGPDGKKYAVGGEVSIDTSPVPGDPQATIQKRRKIKNAALAPASPSSQDLKVAANASSQSLKALSELTLLQAEKQAEQREAQAFGNKWQETADAYIKVNTLPEEDTSTFEIAV